MILTDVLPQVCDDPISPATDFTSVSEQAFVILIFDFNAPAPTGTVGADWVQPDGRISHSVVTPTGGFFCFYDTLRIAGTPAATFGGVWHVKVYHDFTPPASPDSGLLGVVSIGKKGGLGFAPTGCSAPGLN